MATDLRLIASLLHVLKNIERMGDQCVNVCKVIPMTGHEPPVDEEILAVVSRMGELAISEVRQSKQAFQLRDVELAHDLVRQDEEINKLNRDVFRMGVAAGGRDEDRLEWVLTMVMVARAIERVGDNAVDIGEQVAFVVTGLFQEFEDASHPEPVQPAT